MEAEQRGTYTREGSSIELDAIELDPEFQLWVAAIDQEVDETLKTHPRYNKLGYCHFFWAERQQLLWERHGIVWRPPSELNWNVCFD